MNSVLKEIAFAPGVKNCHDEVAAKYHWVCDDNHGGEAEFNEAGDELVEEGDDEEEGEDAAGEEDDPCLVLLGSKSGSYGQGEDGKSNDDWRYIRLQASYLGMIVAGFCCKRSVDSMPAGNFAIIFLQQTQHIQKKLSFGSHSLTSFNPAWSITNMTAGPTRIPKTATLIW